MCYKAVTPHIKEHRPAIIHRGHCGGPQNKHLGKKAVGDPKSFMENDPTEVFSAIQVSIKRKSAVNHDFGGNVPECWEI